MSNTTHTPGPWRISDSRILGHDGAEVVAGIWSIRRDIDGSEEGANARLIAAAPELLEALEEAIKNDLPMSKWVPMARAVIAKAKGTK